MRQKIIVTKICRNCNQPFDIPRWKHHQQFCSTKCKKESQLTTLDYSIILMNPRFSSDNLDELIPITKGMRRALKKRFNNRCVYCGRPLKNSGSNGNSYVIQVQLDNERIMIPICQEDYYQAFRTNPEIYKLYIYQELLHILKSCYE
jgi:hypothetical protein